MVSNHLIFKYVSCNLKETFDNVPSGWSCPVLLSTLLIVYCVFSCTFWSNTQWFIYLFHMILSSVDIFHSLRYTGVLYILIWYRVVYSPLKFLKRLYSLLPYFLFHNNWRSCSLLVQYFFLYIHNKSEMIVNDHQIKLMILDSIDHFFRLLIRKYYDLVKTHLPHVHHCLND